jgi:hypothetical protein
VDTDDDRTLDTCSVSAVPKISAVWHRIDFERLR